jgi:hypothetical protein
MSLGLFEDVKVHEGQDPQHLGKEAVGIRTITGSHWRLTGLGAVLDDASLVLLGPRDEHALDVADVGLVQVIRGKDDGAAPGKQAVSVRKLEIIVKTKQGAENEISCGIPPMPEERWLIPKKFGSPELSGLGLELPDTGNPKIILDLKD